MIESFGETIDMFADWSIGNDDRQRERANGCKGSLRVLSAIMRFVNHGIGEKSTDADKYRRFTHRHLPDTFRMRSTASRMLEREFA